MVSIDWRKTILKIHSQGYKVTLISRILEMPYSTVWNIIRKFQTTKEVADLPRTVHLGRPVRGKSASWTTCSRQIYDFLCCLEFSDNVPDS